MVALVLVVPFLVPIPRFLRYDLVISALGDRMHVVLLAAMTLALYWLGPLAGRLAAAALAAAVDLAIAEHVDAVLFAGDDEEPDQAPAMAAPAEPEPPVLEPEHSGPPPVNATRDDLFDAFLDGLQISRAELHPSVDVNEAMKNAGEILREFITGIEHMLQNRAELKSTFRLDQTTILPRRNNPIKLSENTEDLIKQLLVGRAGEYLGPRDAAREVCQDLLAHQDALLDAMTEAFLEFAERFDPEELSASFARSADRKPWFRFLRQSQYWNLYTDLYPVLTEKGGGRFPQMFAAAFAAAYERNIVDFLREQRLGSTLPKVKLEPLSEEAFNAEQAAAKQGGVGPSDQAVHSPDKAPGEVLENISDLSGLEELVDFDDLGARSGAADETEDDPGQAKA